MWEVEFLWPIFPLFRSIMTWYFISEPKFQAQMGIFLAMIMSVSVILAEVFA